MRDSRGLVACPERKYCTAIPDDRIGEARGWHKPPATGNTNNAREKSEGVRAVWVKW